MRAFLRLLIKLIFGALIGLVLLPETLVREFIVGRMADRMAEALGMNTLATEDVLRWLVPLIPFLAALALLQVYVSLYEFISPPRQDFIKEAPSITSRLKVARNIGYGVFAVGVVAVFIWAQYSYREPASEKLRFFRFTQMSNPELRNEAFMVADTLDNINRAYLEKVRILQEDYRRKLDKWYVTNNEYESAKAADDAWNSNYEYSYAFVGSTRIPVRRNTFPYNNYSFSGNSLLGVPQTTTAPEPIPPEPKVPASPGPKPTFQPSDTDQEWRRQLTEAEEEAAAVWQEINNRHGGYPAMFDIPLIYAPGDGLAPQSSRLRNLGNSLH